MFKKQPFSLNKTKKEPQSSLDLSNNERDEARPEGKINLLVDLRQQIAKAKQAKIEAEKN